MRGELFDPTQVPTFPVEIDYAHPLAQGLGGLYIPALGGCDIVGAGPPLTYPGGIAGGTFGPGAGSTTSDYASSIEPAPVSWLTASEVTLVAICTMGSTAALNNAAFFEISYDSSGAAPYLVWGLNTNNVADFAVYLNNVGAFNNGNQSTTPPPINSSFVAAGTIVIGGNSIAYLNGNSIYTAPASTPGPNYTSTSYINFNVNTKAVMHAGSIYLRALAPELIAWLSAEPFAMLRRRKLVRYYAAPTGADTGSLAETNAAASVTSAAILPVSGALAETNAPNTLSSTATLPVSGALTETNASNTFTSGATLPVSGTLAETNASNTFSSSVTLPVSGALAETNALNTLISSATLPVSGALVETNAPHTFTSAGDVGNDSLIETQQPNTLTSSATLSVSGALSATESGDTLSAHIQVGAILWNGTPDSGTPETTWIAPIQNSTWEFSPPTPPAFYLDSSGRIVFMPTPLQQLQDHTGAATERYNFDFTNALAPGETISASAVTLTTTDSAMTLSNPQAVGGLVSFLMNGGTSGGYATITCSAPTSLGQNLVGEFIVKTN